MRAGTRHQWLFAPDQPTSRARDVVDTITLAVAEHYGANICTVRGTTRRRPYGRIRMVAMYVARRLTELRCEDIGLVMDRHHSTIVHGVQTVEAELLVDPFLRRSVAMCLKRAQEALGRLDAVDQASTAR